MGGEARTAGSALPVLGQRNFAPFFVGNLLSICSTGFQAIAQALLVYRLTAFGALAIAGFGYLASQTRATTLLLLEVEDHERGRIMALWSVAFLGSRRVASLLDGALATALGPRSATLVMALPVLLAAAAVRIWRPPATGDVLTGS